MRNINIAKWLGGILILAMVFNACTKENNEVLFTGDSYENIYQYIQRDEVNYSKFVALVDAGEMEGSLSSYNSHLYGSNYSLFLPDNNAIDAFVEENSSYATFDDLLADTEFVKLLVRYHVINQEILSNDFPNGVLSSPALTSDYLTVNFSVEENGDISYKINNESEVVVSDILKSNGVIHKIDKVLTPVAYTAYDWLQIRKTQGFGIFAQLLEQTGLQDTLEYFDVDIQGNIVYPGLTMFVEPDELYYENKIMSFDDLAKKISPDNSNYQDESNALNRFARYHILNTSVYLDQFNSGLYNTYGEYPVAVDAMENDFVFNKGTAVFEEIVVGEDTTTIDYLKIDVPNSNIPAKTGPIHQLDQILYEFKPALKTVDINFYNEPIITQLRSRDGTFALSEENLEYTSLVGTDFLLYFHTSNTIDSLQNNDEVRLFGSFELTHQTDKILAGTYRVSFRAKRGSSINAMVQLYVDGEKVGGVMDLTSAHSSESNYLPDFVLDKVSFEENGTHEITIKTIKPGNMYLDRIILTPVSN